MSSLTIRNLRKSFGSLEVLKGINLHNGWNGKQGGGIVLPKGWSFGVANPAEALKNLI